MDAKERNKIKARERARGIERSRNLKRIQFTAWMKTSTVPDTAQAPFGAKMTLREYVETRMKSKDWKSRYFDETIGICRFLGYIDF